MKSAKSSANQQSYSEIILIYISSQEKLTLLTEHIYVFHLDATLIILAPNRLQIDEKCDGKFEAVYQEEISASGYTSPISNM